jgi:4-hydroxybenzoate polyprenyltransferase
VIDYLRMMRIGDWIKFYPIIPIIGALLAGAAAVQVLLIWLIYFALIGYAFVVNNYYDVEIDRLHRGKAESDKNPLASGAISRRGVQVEMVILVGVTFLSLSFSLPGFYLVLLNLILVTAYSGGPRLKDVPLLDIVTHGLMFGALPFLAGFALVQGAITRDALLLAAIPFLLGCEALIAHQVAEYEMDIEGTKTTITRTGKGKGLVLLGVLEVVSIAILLYIAAAHAVNLPAWALAAAGWYLLAYPVYSCRGILGDIRHRASAE